MKFTINNNEYQYIENTTVYQFIRKHNIFMPYFDENKYQNIKYDISYVEIVGYEKVVNSKETML